MEITEELNSILADANDRVASAADKAELGRLKSEFLGKKSRLKELQKGLGKLDPQERPIVGAEVNKIAKVIEEAIQEKEIALAEVPSSGSPSSAASSTKKKKKKTKIQPLDDTDFTRPGFTFHQGLPHPLFTTIDEIVSIFSRLGYGVAEGPDIEDDEYNFTDLNFPPEHPARDAQDTFFLEPIRADNPLLLRTHTSPVQIRVMEELAPPFSVIVPGRTYRSDTPDATHSPIFHQVEGLVVGADITMAHLKGTLEYFVKSFYGDALEVRFRPSFFPFTEPSAEVDVSCVACAGKNSASCRVCKGTGFLEILGAGMVDPKIFEAVCRRRGDEVYDSEKITGFAFGMGVERLAMLRYGIDDLRLFYENDPRFLEQFA